MNRLTGFNNNKEAIIQTSILWIYIHNVKE